MSSGLLVYQHLLHTVRRPQDKVFFCRQFGFGLCDGDFVGILCLRRLYRHCKVVLTGVSRVVIMQTGSSFFVFVWGM